MVNKSTNCNGFCPECGSDLAFANLECQCKNPLCTWSCHICKESNENSQEQKDLNQE